MLGDKGRGWDRGRVDSRVLGQHQDKDRDKDKEREEDRMGGWWLMLLGKTRWLVVQGRVGSCRVVCLLVRVWAVENRVRRGGRRVVNANGISSSRGIRITRKRLPNTNNNKCKSMQRRETDGRHRLHRKAGGRLVRGGTSVVLLLLLQQLVDDRLEVGEAIVLDVYAAASYVILIQKTQRTLLVSVRDGRSWKGCG